MQVLGRNPYNNFSYMDTKELARHQIRSMSASDDLDADVYIKNLAVFVSWKLLFKLILIVSILYLNTMEICMTLSRYVAGELYSILILASLILSLNYYIIYFCLYIIYTMIIL